MEHDTTWFSFMPGYNTLAHAFEGGGILFGSPTTVQHICAGILVTFVVLALSAVAKRQLDAAGNDAVIPDPNISIRNIFEVALEGLYAQAKTIIGPEAPRYFPIIGTLALFIFFSNILGLVPGFTPPTNNWNTTMACGGLVFVYYNYHGLRAHGLGHIAHMANPVGERWGWWLAPLMFPVELVSHLARPITLGVRLAANMVGDHAVLAAFLGLVPFLVPLPFLVLGLVVCLIQTFVFVLLTMIYIGMAVADTHGDEHAHA